MNKVLVIGDGCKDIFRYGRCDRLCPEAPVPVFKPSASASNDGMAINVYANLIALGVDCDLLTTTGITKTRYVDEVSNQMIVRVDENDHSIRINTNVLESIDFTKYEAVVISDYNKGYLSTEDIEYIAMQHGAVFMDSKKKFGPWCLKVDLIKINEKEYNENKDFLTKNSHLLNLVITKGKHGAMVSNLGNIGEVPIEEEHEVRDLSGAGDTFLAGLVSDYLKTRDIHSAVKFANKCASYVVTQKGVVVVDLTKI